MEQGAEADWSIRVSAQWRLVFRIAKGNTVKDLDYVQYH